jgi:hypothetical protein
VIELLSDALGIGMDEITGMDDEAIKKAFR